MIKNLPKSYVEMVKTWRHIYHFMPMVHRMIHLRVFDFYPGFQITCDDPEALKFYEMVANEVRVDRFVFQLGVAIQALGEGIAFGTKIEVDFPRPPKLVWWKRVLQFLRLIKKPVTKKMKVWGKLGLIAPENIEVRKSVIGPSVTRNFVKVTVDLHPDMLSPKIDMSPDGQLYPVNEELVSVIQNVSNPYDVRGTPNYKWAAAYQALDDHKLFEAFDKPGTPTYDDQKQQSREAMTNWLTNVFFGRLAQWNQIKTPPTIVWDRCETH